MSPRGGDQTHERASEIEPNNVTEKKENEAASRQTGFLQLFLFLRRFLFFLFFSSVSQFYVSATALNSSAMLQITVCCDLTRVWRVKERLYPVFEVFQ